MLRILNTYIFEGLLNRAVKAVIHDVEGNQRKNLCISATGAHGLVYAKRNYEFANILRSFHLNLPDGMPAVWIGKLKGAKEMDRCYGPDFFKETISTSKEKNIKHYINNI